MFMGGIDKIVGHRTKFGLSLTEILVALGLIATSLVIVLALLPTGIRTSQQADDVLLATAWSRRLIEEAPLPETFPIPDELAVAEFEEIIAGTHFKAQRTLATPPGQPYLLEAEVVTSWRDDREPIRLSIVYYNPAGPER